MKSFFGVTFSVGLAVAITTCIGVWLNYSPVPWWDQWYGTISWYMRAENNWWAEFWSSHNEHRLLISRLIFWPDVRWFGGINILSFVSTLIFCALLSFAFILSANYKSKRSDGLFVTGLSLAFCFSWLQSQNFTWAFQNQWFAVAFFALLSFHFMERASASKSWVWIGASITAAIAATFSMANGCLTWPLLVALAIYFRMPFMIVMAVVVTGTAVVFANFWHNDVATGSLPNGTMAFALTHDPIGLVAYAIYFLGSPAWFAFQSWSLAFLSGLLVIAATAYGCFAALRRRDMIAIALLTMAAFICLTAVITAGGRLVLGLNNVFQSRYATDALAVWLSLLLFWLVNARFKSIAYAGAVLCLIPICIAQPGALRPDRTDLFEKRLAGQALREHVFEHQYLSKLWDNDNILKEISLQAEALGLSILAKDTIGYDNPPSTISVAAQCSGALDRILPTDTAGKSRADGWAFYEPSAEIPRFILVTDAENHPIGSGVFGISRPDAADPMKSKDNRLGWAAFYTTTDNARFFAKLRDGRYCRFN